MSPQPRIRVAVAGFGPFPGVLKNPSGEIVRALSKMQRFRSSGIELQATVLDTAYGKAEAALDRLIAHKPDAIVLFGVAGRTKHIRVETIARNRVSLLHPDRDRVTPAFRKLSAKGAPFLKVRGSAIHMRAAIRAAGARAELSINAGNYLCNAVFYHALAAAKGQSPGPLTFFIHVPPARSGTQGMRALVRAGLAAVWAAAHEAKKLQIVPRRDG